MCNMCHYWISRICGLNSCWWWLYSWRVVGGRICQTLSCQRCCSCGELIDSLDVGVPRVFEEDHLKQDVGVEYFNEQKGEKQDVGARLDAGAEVAIEESGPRDGLHRQTGDIPGYRSEHAENSGNEI